MHIGAVRAHAFSEVRTMVCDVLYYTLYIIYVVIIFKSVYYLYYILYTGRAE